MHVVGDQHLRGDVTDVYPSVGYVAAVIQHVPCTQLGRRSLGEFDDEAACDDVDKVLAMVLEPFLFRISRFDQVVMCLQRYVRTAAREQSRSLCVVAMSGANDLATTRASDLVADALLTNRTQYQLTVARPLLERRMVGGVLLLSDPRLLDIPLVDCGEDLVDLRRVPQLELDPRKEDSAGAWARMRRGVVDRLLAAQETLPTGVRLLVVEGHRPAERQKQIFDGHSTDLAQLHPEWDVRRVMIEASKHVSPPSVAPHPCGAAVDLTLTRGGELDLGTAINATPEDSEEACFTAASNISVEARNWREVLGLALSGVGLVNYPPEWWHWSYGDRYWAAATGAQNAVYGPR